MPFSNSKIGALDRSLGFLFGAVRGLLLCVIAFVFFNWLVPAQTQPGWVKTARMRPLLQATGDRLMAVLPDDPEGLLNKLKKPKSAGASEETVPDTDQEPKKAETWQRDVSAGTGAFWGGGASCRDAKPRAQLAAIDSWGKPSRFDDAPERGLVRA